jgi:hypothetical protein
MASLPVFAGKDAQATVRAGFRRAFVVDTFASIGKLRGSLF